MKKPSKGIIIGIIVFIALATIVFSRQNTERKSSEKQTTLQNVLDCQTVTINRLNQLEHQDGDFQETPFGWRVSPQKNGNKNLSQIFPLAYYPECDFTTGTLSVDFKLIEGKEDKYAGLVFGLTSLGDYYAVRASGSENNVIIAKFVNGKREKVKTIDNVSISINEWHELKVDIKDESITVIVDNKQITQDFPLQVIAGRVGVNTKSDSVTEFRNLTIQSQEKTVSISTPSPTSSSVQAPDIVDEQGIANATAKIQQALSQPNASQMQALLINEAVVSSTSGGQMGEASSKQEVINWLNSHWSNNLQYISRHYVDHFGYWEVTTTGWKDTSSGEVNFRLFRYDAQGQRSVTESEWLIYVVIY